MTTEPKRHPVTGALLTRQCRTCGEHRHIVLDYRRGERTCKPCYYKAAAERTRQRRQVQRDATGDLRFCRRCQQRKDVGAAFRDRRHICRACESERNSQAEKVQRAEARLEALASGSVLPTRAIPHPGPFDITRVKLEKQWGPYHRWTREQHARHTAAIRKLTGLPPLPEQDILAARLDDEYRRRAA